MEYYLISLIITIIIFGIIQIYEYNKIRRFIEENGSNYIEPYSIFTTNNILLIIILYIVLTISCYYLNVSEWKLLKEFKKIVEVKKTSIGGGTDNKIEEIDPKILSKINDNFDVGFEPFASDIDDASSISSLNSN